MAVLTPVNPALTGAAPVFVAAGAGGDTFPNDGHTLLHVKNGGGGAINVTVDSKVPCSQGADHDVIVSVPAAGERIIGPFAQDRFGTDVNITYSGVVTVTVAAIKGA